MNPTREIPAGKVLLCDHPAAEEMATTTIIAEQHNATKRRTYRLVCITPGYVLAGSTCRWQNGSYAVLYEMNHARHGQHFKTEAEARDRFTLWTGSDD